MNARVVQIRRHPIKGIGTELLETATLKPGRPLPMDRAWAVLQDGETDTGGWQRRRTFVQCAAGPALMAITAKAGADTISLHHPDRPDLTFDPETEGERLCDWLMPIWPEARPRPTDLIRAPETGMADLEYASVSIMSFASLRSLSEKLGQALDPRRFRGNIWIDGPSPWEEFDWVGRKIQVGGADLEITERIERCRATEANPDTGQRDVDPPRALQTHWGHRDFGVAARVTRGGTIAPGDSVTLL